MSEQKFEYDHKTGESKLNYDRKRDGRSVTITTPGRKDDSGNWWSKFFKGGK